MFSINTLRNMLKFFILSFLIFGMIFSDSAHAKTTITFWTFLNPEAADPRSKALKATIEGFMADNPDIEVKVESIHWGKIDSLAIQAAAAGTGPDVLNVYSVQLTKHVRAKTILPLNTFIDKWYPKNKDDYLIQPKNTEFDGSIVGLPWELRVWLLWYRQDLLEKAGAKNPPRSLDELLKIASKINSDKVHGFVVGLSETQLAAAFVETFEPLLWAQGATLVDAKGRAAFNGKEGVRAMQWIADLYKKKATGQATVTMNADDILSGFKAGTIAMSFQGSMRVSAARAAKDIGDKIRTASVPSFEPGKPGPALTAGQCLTMGASVKNKEAAWKFIEYYLSPKAQVLFAKAGVLPVRKSVYRDPYFNTPEGHEMNEWKSYIDKYGKIGRYPEDFAKLSELLARAAQDVVLRNVPIKKALDDAAAKYNAQTGL